MAEGKVILIYKKGNLLGSAGGIEHVLSWLANSLSERGYKVYLATRDKKDAELFYPVSDKVHFKKFSVKFSKIRRIIGQLTFNLIPYFNRERYIASMIRDFCDEIKPDIILTSGVQDMFEIIYKNPYPCYKMVQLHSYPKIIFTKKKKKLFINTLKNVDLVQVLLPSFQEVIKKYYSGKSVAIANSVSSINLTNEERQIQENSKIIIFPARIDRSKQPHLLIEAFHLIATKYPDWQVHFYGGKSNQDYYQYCQSLIQKYHLEKQVFFKGVSSNMAQELKKASFCAFPSAFEGFSLALTECFSAGLPCVGFKNAPSVNELIQHDFNGYLAQDVIDFALYMEKLILDKLLRQRLGQNAVESMKKYSKETILAQYEQVFQNIDVIEKG